MQTNRVQRRVVNRQPKQIVKTQRQILRAVEAKRATLNRSASANAA